MVDSLKANFSADGDVCYKKMTKNILLWTEGIYQDKKGHELTTYIEQKYIFFHIQKYVFVS